MQPRSLSKTRQRRGRGARQPADSRRAGLRADPPLPGLPFRTISVLCCRGWRAIPPPVAPVPPSSEMPPQFRLVTFFLTFFQTVWAFISLVLFGMPSDLRLPIPGPGRRKTLVLDLDETLVHTSTSFDARGAVGDGSKTIAPELRLDVVSSTNLNRQNRTFYVRLRPYVHEFLRECSEIFDIVVFTASEQNYAEPIIQYICSESGVPYPRRCFFRQSCDATMGLHVKDLSKVRQDLSKVVLIDNSPGAAAYQPENYIPCMSWFGSQEDTELLDMLVLLRELSRVSDVRSLLGLRLSRAQLL